MEDLFQSEQFRDITFEPLKQIAPLVAGVEIPANQDGVVDPGFIGQIAVNQRVLDISTRLEIYKLQCMIMWMVENPRPGVAPTQEALDVDTQRWGENLCKYLHEKVNNFAKEMFEALKQAQVQKQSKIVLPGQRNGIVRP
jgi:hypothetical protein